MNTKPPMYKKIIVNKIDYDNSCLPKLILHTDDNSYEVMVKSDFPVVEWEKVKYPLQLYVDEILTMKLLDILPKYKHQFYRKRNLNKSVPVRKQGIFMEKKQKEFSRRGRMLAPRRTKSQSKHSYLSMIKEMTKNLLGL